MVARFSMNLTLEVMQTDEIKTIYIKYIEFPNLGVAPIDFQKQENMELI